MELMLVRLACTVGVPVLLSAPRVLIYRRTQLWK